MYTYAVLKNPEYTRVSFQDSNNLAVNELTLSIPAENITHAEIGGVPYLLFSREEALTEADITTLSRLSFAYAIFQKEADNLIPITVNPAYFLNREISSILKYQGKTNELFTRLMLNLALLNIKDKAPLNILDPLAGKGTTLFEALMQGHNAYGIEIDPKMPQEAMVYLKKYLETNRIKHTNHTEKISGVSESGKFTSLRHQIEIAKKIQFEIISGDSRNAPHFYKKHQFHVITADLPYGVQHGSRTAKTTSRNPLGLLTEAVEGWVKLLRPGGVMVLAWNLFLIPRSEIITLLESHGLKIPENISKLDFVHKVDQAIERDVISALKQGGVPVNITLPGENGVIGGIIIDDNNQPLIMQNYPGGTTPIGQTSFGQREVGESVSLVAGVREGFTFVNWTSDQISITNATNPTNASFIMPNHPVTIIANWEQAVIGNNGRLITSSIGGRIYTQGDTFSATLRIEENTGFANMATRLTIPAGLKLTHVELGNASNLNIGFVPPYGHNPTTGEIAPISGPAYAFAHWGGRTDNFTDSNTTLLTYTFMVVGSVNPSDLIRFAFADRLGYSLPSNANGVPLEITLPGGGSGVLGSITAELDYSILYVSATPSNQPISVGRGAEFDITVRGMPPNQTYFFDNSSVVGQIGSIHLDLPDDIIASGSLTTNANGVGTGTLILTLDENFVGVADFSFIYHMFSPIEMSTGCCR